ncbi:MAG: M20/M25/M40 family metallo-hydrolase [Candidatus Cloacimonetes bacterium]|nr:M20/M25/M40 family metallo-hydrolase [Candidatus Cloacimonadota bacterium]
MFEALAKRIEALTLDFVNIRSVVGSSEENNMSERVYEVLSSVDYFARHPQQLKYVMAKDDALNRKSVVAVLKGEKKPSAKTLVLIGHTDTVGISDYGTIQEYATRPLELAEKIRELSLPEDAIEDLESGEYYFGRGVFDMKCGTSTLLSIVEQLSKSPQDFEGNLIFAAVCDEEGGSKGMLSVVDELIHLQEKEGFEYLAVIDTDYSAPRYEGDNTRYIYVGTVGKLMPSFYVVGAEAHAGDPFKGVDSNHLSSAIMEEMNFNTAYCDEAEGEVTVPPISLRQQDLKPEYSVQTNRASYLYFNFSTHSSTPEKVMEMMIKGADTAFQKVVDSLNEEYEKYCRSNKFPFAKLPWESRVMSYDQLYAKVKAEKGDELDTLIKAKCDELMQDPDLDERIFALKMVEYLHNLWSDVNPVVIAYYSPPYYPHIYVKDESEREKHLLGALKNALGATQSKYDVAIKKFYPYISDLSYAAAPREANAIESLKNNMPGFGVKYDLPLENMQKLNLPVVNIGPFGKGAHKYTERLEKDYSFNVAPKLVYNTIMELLK